MKEEIKVPQMGESISSATIGAILKPNGSKVLKDEEVIELETDKVNQVLYAPIGGVIQWNISPDETVKIGQVIGTVDGKGVEKALIEPVIFPEKMETPIQKVSLEPSSGIRLGKEALIQDLSIKEEPLLTEVKVPAPKIDPPVVKEGGETRRKMTKIRKVIAERLVKAQQTTAMLTTFNEVDLGHVIALGEKYKEAFQKEHGVKLGFMSFFVKAAVSALEMYPEVNSYIDQDDIVQRGYIDISIAIGTDRGVLVPVVKDCDLLSFAEIESSIEAFAKKARDGTITADDLTGGGFTITNGGTYGSLLSTPILNPPQSAILGMHKIEKRPVVVNDQIVIRQMMYVALSYDHRLIDGKEAVSFLVHIKNCLEDPSRLLLAI